MKPLSNPRLMWVKAGLFVLLGSLASALLVTQLPDVRYAVLLAIAIWSFCRAYYFAFYVMERYVDPTYRFAGLIHFARYSVLGHAPDVQNDEQQPL